MREGHGPGSKRRPLAIGVALALIASALIATPNGSASAQPLAESPGPIRLVTGDVDLGALERLEPSEIAGAGRYLVQFDGPVSGLDRAALEEQGARVLGFVPNHAYVVRLAPGARIPDLDRIHAIAPFDAAWRVSPRVAADQLVRIELDDAGDAASVTAAAAGAGLSVLRSSGRFLVAYAEGSIPAAVAGHEAVAWIEPLPRFETHNEEGGAIIGIPSAHALGYDGSSQIVAVADTGLGDAQQDGDPTDGTYGLGDPHPDMPASRIVEVLDYPGASLPGCYTVEPDGAIDVDSGHGTHVAGSVLSDGDPSGIGLGQAPAAALVFQAVEDWTNYNAICSLEDDAYLLVGIPDDIGDLLQDAYDLGARIHSDSWGSSADPGAYTSDAESADEFMWNNPDFLMVTSAGNDGIDDDSNGVVDQDSIGSPATAKNLLTVGASENERPDDFPCDDGLSYTNPNTGLSCQTQVAGSGFNDIFTYGSAWPTDYPSPPLSTDESAGDAEQMAAFSSRGPTDDGRIKPDVVAPGTWVLSGYSNLYQEGYGVVVNPQNGAYQYDGWGFPYSTDYKYMGGTSMSAPIVSGAAAVVRDYYWKAHTHEASAALTKATLINSADDLLDENNDGVDDNDFPIPNDHEGWGRINAAEAVDDDHVFLDGVEAQFGESTTVGVAVTGGDPLKVSLVWTDRPSTTAALVNLVNDLDLIVTAPDETIYRGNNFSGGWSVSGGSADTINPVENVYVETAAAGTWTIEVAGSAMPMGGTQPFALVVHGASFTDGTPPQWPDGAALDQTDATIDSVTVDWSANPATDEVGVVGYDVSVDGVFDQSVAGTSATITGLTEATTYSISVEARDAAGNSTTDGPSVSAATLDETDPSWTDPGLEAKEVLETSLELHWNAATDANEVTYDVFVSAAGLLGAPDHSTSGTSIVLDGLAADTEYDLTVVPRDSSGNAAPGETLAVTTAPDFDDTNGHIFHDDIAWLAAKGITLGCDDDNYCPNDALTRAQMASLLARAFDLPTVEGNRFDDVSGVHTANINAIAEAGITLGCTPDGLSFCPNDELSRAQMGSFLARAFDLDPSDADAFTDDDGSVHEGNIDAIAIAGITLGCGPSLYCPFEVVTRGQLAAFLHRGFVNLGLE